jgi:hypothetical protein
MGGWVCIKSLEKLPDVQKGFVLSAWNISDVTSDKQILADREKPMNILY